MDRCCSDTGERQGRECALKTRSSCLDLGGESLPLLVAQANCGRTWGRMISDHFVWSCVLLATLLYLWFIISFWCGLLVDFFVSHVLVRLGLVVVFTAVFSLALALFSNSRRVEVFMASSTFAAIQVVFVTSSATVRWWIRDTEVNRSCWCWRGVDSKTLQRFPVFLFFFRPKLEVLSMQDWPSNRWSFDKYSLL